MDIIEFRSSKRFARALYLLKTTIPSIPDQPIKSNATSAKFSNEGPIAKNGLPLWANPVDEDARLEATHQHAIQLMRLEWPNR